MSGLVISLIVSTAALAVLGFMLWRAPLGWEDSEGFHYGEPDEHGQDGNLGI